MATLTQDQRLALKILKKNSLVKKITHSYYKVKTTFSTGISETWVLRDHHIFKFSTFSSRFPTSNLFIREIPTYSEFETRPLDEDENEFLKPFFILQRKDIDKAGFLDIRLAVHTLIDKLLSEGWIDLKYPKPMLQQDLSILLDCDPNRFFMEPNLISAFAKYGYHQLSTPGRTLAEHFLRWGDHSDGKKTLREVWTDPSSLFSAIQELLGTAKDITRSNIVRHFGIRGGRRHSGPKYFDPRMYYSLIKNLFPNAKSVYDANPKWGSKMLAAAAAEQEYAADALSDGLQEMAEFVGCDARIVENKKYDIGILSDTEPMKAEEAIPALDRSLRMCKGTLILVDRSDVEEIKSKFMPRRSIKTQLYPNFLIKRMGYHYFLAY
jgi:hypothetical protein